ncbi:DUF1702 family protein [Actinoplanes siamensis]|uniref:Enediyne biosynthesis protein n=1 Tax=Actinoplanes siamensis TaxID=1223317 RepID=A0A919NC54_9ACTN|nr:DUF1702 family protein [Actinoplanes siamensis]GIF08487.1 enediyne biosynthesis protein [Actinoplanes siamensis]
MTGILGAFRRRLFTPGAVETKLETRGFHFKNAVARDNLETIGETFLEGLGNACEVSCPDDVLEPLQAVPVRYRGFAYEGAAMGFAIRDALPVGRRDHIRRFLDGSGDPHLYMALIGVGWAMARLPRPLWRRIMPADPLLNWLALDGYGFHQAYFRTDRYVREHYRETEFGWPADTTGTYAGRAIDQGIGRALWFVGGCDATVVAGLVEGYPADRRAELYSGAGLAATYAGGADDAELKWFLDRAGDHRAQVAQGSAFAASARVRAGLVVPHNEAANRVLCGMSTAEAAQLCDRERPRDGAARGGTPAYEVWRQRVAGQFVSLGRN